MIGSPLASNAAMEQDLPRAISYLENHIEDDDFNPSSYFRHLVEVSGRKKIADAFALLDRFQHRLGNPEVSNYGSILREFAKNHREDLLASAPVCGAWGDFIRESLLVEWIGKDFQ